MIILSIETSCDETAVSIVEANGGLKSPTFSVLGNALFSQIDIHKEYGGVFPMVAKREHAKKLPILLKETLKETQMFISYDISYEMNIWEEFKNITSREEGLYENFRKLFENVEKPKIDVISVTAGPGLVPALWVGVSFATALGKLWSIPVVGANHMEGHIASVLLDGSDGDKNNVIRFPALALLISGGHTELVEIKGWGKYNIIGETRDDAVGEAFDKVARMLELPYPGGPHISAMADMAREKNLPHIAKLPRPMIHSDDFDFSFAGLKTAVLYYLRDHPDFDKSDVAREFEDAVTEVLLKKTKKALEQTGAKTLIIAGGVIANKKLREVFTRLSTEYEDLAVKIPERSLTGDNAIMIAYATYIHVSAYPELLKGEEKIIANGNLRLNPGSKAWRATGLTT